MERDDLEFRTEHEFEAPWRARSDSTSVDYVRYLAEAFTYRWRVVG